MRRLLLSFLVTLSMAVAPARAGEPGYSVTADVPFGDLPHQVLDIYTPAAVADDTPVLVFLFGGGFRYGDKSRPRLIGESFAKTGTIVVAPNYRTNAAFPTFIEDAAKAVAHVRQELRTSRDDPRSIIVSGWSAGAYIGGAVSYDGRYLDAQGLPSDTVSGFIGLAGPYRGGLCAGARCDSIFPPATKADWPVASFVDPGDPPMLLVQGTLDNYVDIANLETLAAAGDAAGLDVTTLVVEKRSHRSVMSDMESPGTEVRRAVEAFLAQIASD